VLEFFLRKGDGAGAVEMGEVSSARGTFMRASSAMLNQVPAAGSSSISRGGANQPTTTTTISSTSEQIDAKEKRNWGHCVLERDEGKKGNCASVP
jgi:hypothetical protein